MNSEICIIGGGPAGLSAAIALTQSGREVTLLDCAVPPIDKACGEGLMPDSLAALSKLGVALSNLGTPLRGISFVGAEASVSSNFPNGMGRSVRRVALHQRLVAAAESLGIRMFWGVRNVHTQPGCVTFDGGYIKTQLIVGADGQKSLVRREAGLDRFTSEMRRYGFRKHYAVAPWSDYVEVYWGRHFQVYISPVTSDQLCVALISNNPHLRLNDALCQLPLLAARLNGAPPVTAEKGSLSISRSLQRVHTAGYVLLGDASGSVDAITGEGMCLAFQQSAALVEALDAGDLRLYQRRHRQISAKPLRMAKLMLLLDSNQTLQRKALAALAGHPGVFRSLLAIHVGHCKLTDVVSWQLLSFGFGVLCA
jgi:2-polyprenyl-6-methoxyphenol hydroxylase-like FAD-dependent oxidoreductase